MDLLIFVWGTFFLFAIIPGGISGYLLAKLPIATWWLVAIAAVGSVVVGYTLSKSSVPNDLATIDVHMANVFSYSPPIFAALLVGALSNRFPWLIGRSP